MVVYADIIFGMNVLMDLAILKTTAWAGKITTNRWRLWLSAAIGASYVIMIFFPGLSFLFTFVVKVLFSLCMVWVAFGFGSLQMFLRHVGLFYAVNFTVAGGIFALHYALQSSHAVFNGIVFVKTGGSTSIVPLTVTFVIVVFFLMIFFYRLTYRSQMRRKMMTDYTAQVYVTIDGVEVMCTGLIDTGNQLYDPLSRTPVMMMDAQCWKGHLPANFVELLQTKEMNRWMKMITNDDGKWNDRLRIVPYKGIQNGQQMMVTIKADKVVIRHQEQEIHPEKVLVGFHENRLSSDGSYEAIIHPALVQANEEVKKA